MTGGLNPQAYVSIGGCRLVQDPRGLGTPITSRPAVVKGAALPRVGARRAQ